jgi:hypothetical protein
MYHTSSMPAGQGCILDHRECGDWAAVIAAMANTVATTISFIITLDRDYACMYLQVGDILDRGDQEIKLLSQCGVKQHITHSRRKHNNFPFLTAGW